MKISLSTLTKIRSISSLGSKTLGSKTYPSLGSKSKTAASELKC